MDNYSVREFTKAELNKYLKILDVKAEIKLGLLSDFGYDIQVEDPYFDDAFAIDVKDKCGHIAGSNERSILFGVYRLLEEWGIDWIKPGPLGTRYPEKCDTPDVKIVEKAAKRHRIMCIEGAVSIENCLDMIEWLPKRCFNGYYIQFDNAFIFFERWYTHRRNPYKEPEEFTVEKSYEYVGLMTEEIKKRGLLLHRMGHGWTCEPFGIPNMGWDPVDPATIPKEFNDICALVKGERKCWKDIPVRTQLCYSNPFVQKTMVDAVLKYVHDNPETDVVHFWLGDDINNTCECEDCTKLHYSDYYVNIVNQITEKFVEEGIEKKVVFSTGYNKQCPPKEIKLKHPDRAIMMFAPITRTYGESFPKEFKIKTSHEYKVNAFDYPTSVDENLAMVYNWEQYTDADFVDFDYHLMWDHLLDAGGECISRVIYEDIRNFDSLGLNGYISCQLQRNAFPNALAMTVMGKVLWNNDVEFEDIKRELYKTSYGADSVDAISSYLGTLSKAFNPGYLRSQIKVDPKVFRKNMEEALKTMTDFEGYIDAHIITADPIIKEHFELLKLDKEIYYNVGLSALAKLDDKAELAKEYHDKASDIIMKNEDKLQAVYDCMHGASVTGYRVNMKGMIAFTDEV